MLFNILFALFVVACVVFIVYYNKKSAKASKCDECGGELVEIGNNWNMASCMTGGYDTIFKCVKCGKQFKIHHYTYD